LDARELENFFLSRDATGECPVCGYSGLWERTAGDFDLKLLTTDGRQEVDVVAVFCANCGLVRLHAIELILGKQDKSRPEN
jgi:hypothetical protein